MKRGCCYLFAILDWYSRLVVSGSLYTPMDVSFCVAAFRAGVRRMDRSPGIFKPDQGSQFTSEEWVGELLSHRGLRISMDGKGRWVDNVIIERLWRSVKYEDIYLKAYASPRELEWGLADWFSCDTTPTVLISPSA